MVRCTSVRRSARAMLAAAVGAVALFSSPIVKAAEPTQQELMDELQALRAKVERLEAAQAKQEQKPDPAEVRQTVDGVLRDADRRSQILPATGFTAGYSKNRFVLQSEDGNFVLSPSVALQVRYVANYREEDADNSIDGDATSETGFEIRRLKLALEGNVFTPDTKYKFEWASNRNGGAVTLEDGFVLQKINFAPDFQIRAGQFKDVTFHEEITSFKNQLAVDRSLANEVLAGGQTDFVQGVGIIWDDGAEGLPLRAEAGFTDGPNTDNTNFVAAGGSPSFGAANPDFGLYGRVEYLAKGPWKYYDDFTTMKNVEDLLVFGAGAFYTQAGDNNVIFHTFDVQYEIYRLGLYAAYYGVYSDGVEDNSYDVGGVVQAGYMLDSANKWEVFGRYSLIALDTGPADSDDTYHEFTGGVNYYLHSHAAKFTVDVSYLPSGVPGNQDQIGELDPDADDDQIVFRGQFQLVL